MARRRGCAELNELYQRTPKSDRDYWLWTEAFVGIHGGDVCGCTGLSTLASRSDMVRIGGYSEDLVARQFVMGSGQEAGQSGPYAEPDTEADIVSESGNESDEGCRIMAGANSGAR